MIAQPIVNENEEEKINKGTIWTFWDGSPPELVLRCIESMRLFNPSRSVVVVSTATLDRFLDPADYPSFSGRPGTPQDFSCPQYLSDWVRLTLLEKYGGVWLDASVVCTNCVESWIAKENDDSSDHPKITMFPMHANDNVHGNWAMAAPRPGHPLIQAWRRDFASVLDSVGPRTVPEQYCIDVFEEYPGLDAIWNKPTPPPLPYLWVYLVLQVLLQKEPELYETVHLIPSIDGPMYRRYQHNVIHGITDAEELSEIVAKDLATQPFSEKAHDQHFIKLVGNDRNPTMAHLDAQDFVKGSVLHFVHTVLQPIPVEYGIDLRQVTKHRPSASEKRPSQHAREQLVKYRQRPSVIRLMPRSSRSSRSSSIPMIHLLDIQEDLEELEGHLEDEGFDYEAEEGEEQEQQQEEQELAVVVEQGEATVHQE